MAVNNSLNLNVTGVVTAGGDGTFTGNTVTEGAVLLGGSANAITDTGVLAKGKILVGDGTTAPTQLTVGANDTVLEADSVQSSGVKYGTTPTATALWELIETRVMSGEAVENFTGLTTALASYRFVISALVPETDAAILRLRTSTDGSTYDTGASDYTNTTPATTITTTYISLSTASGVGNDTGESFMGELICISPASTGYTWFFSRVGYVLPSGALAHGQAYGSRQSAADVEAVQFSFSTGDISTGTIRLYKLSGT